MEPPKSITVAEAAQRLGMIPRTIRRYCVAGLAGQKLGRDWILQESDLPALERFKGRPPGNSPEWKNGKKSEKTARKSRKITKV